MANQYQKYYKINNYTYEQENELLEQGKFVRNYGRLSRDLIEKLVGTGLTIDESQKSVLLSRQRPWRMKRFMKDLLSINPKVGVASVSKGGENSFTYTLRVVDGGITEALGRNQGREDTSKDNQVERRRSLMHILEEQHDSEKVSLQKTVSLADFAPFDNNQEFDVYWQKFELWRELFGSVLVNALPDRPFTMFIYSKDAVGDDVPIYYMELETNGKIDRHTCVWEMDQVLTQVRPGARPHEAEKSSEYASAYQRVYFYLNWETYEERRITKLVISDLAKTEYFKWKQWLTDMHTTSWFDALAAIIFILTGTIMSIIYDDDFGIALVAGIIVSGIAAEEWIPPQTILLGAVARFYAHESLALRVYYRTGNTLTIRRVFITAFATLPEAAKVLGVKIIFPRSEDEGLSFEEAAQLDTFYGLSRPEFVLCFGAAVNIACLFQTLYSGVFGTFSHSDFPRTSTAPQPYVYLPIKENGFLRQIVKDCKPLEEFCSVFRPLIHWQKGIDKTYLGADVDLAAPGSPPSMVSYWLSFPASAVMVVDWIYGRYHFALIPLVILEQIVAMLGAVLIILSDIPVVLALFVTSFLRRSRTVPRSLIRALTGVALMGYILCDVSLWVIMLCFHTPIAKILQVESLTCRSRSTARLYRFPLIKSVRTGRSSNHSWKFGDYIYDNAYHRCSDMVIVNPRASKLGMMEENRHFYKRHKLIWTQKDGIRYITPILACGDNTDDRLKGQNQVREEDILNSWLGKIQRKYLGNTIARQDEPETIEHDQDQNINSPVINIRYSSELLDRML